MNVKNLLAVFVICIVASGCNRKVSTEKGDPYGIEKREREQYLNEKYKQRLFDEEVKKLIVKPKDSVKPIESPAPRSLTPDDAYNIGYENGYQQGLEDKEEGEEFEARYDDTNDFYDYYNTRYCEGYEEGYSVGYEEGKVNQ